MNSCIVRGYTDFEIESVCEREKEKEQKFDSGFSNTFTAIMSSSSESSDKNEKQFQSLHAKAMQAKELENESKYKQLFIDLINKKKTQIVTAIGSSGKC